MQHNYAGLQRRSLQYSILIHGYYPYSAFPLVKHSGDITVLTVLATVITCRDLPIMLKILPIMLCCTA